MKKEKKKNPHFYCRLCLLKRLVTFFVLYKEKTTCKTCSSRSLWMLKPFISLFLPPNKLHWRRTKHTQSLRSRKKKKKIMECVFGLVGNGFAVVAADTSAVNSILVHKSNEDKIMVLDSHKLIAASGESGDRFFFHLFLFFSLKFNFTLFDPDCIDTHTHTHIYIYIWLCFFLGKIGFSLPSTYRRMWLCTNSVMGFHWLLLLLLTLPVGNSPPL